MARWRRGGGGVFHRGVGWEDYVLYRLPYIAKILPIVSLSHDGLNVIRPCTMILQHVNLRIVKDCTCVAS
jgi:hypothetical protein